MDKKLDGFAFAVSAMADEFGFKIDGAMIAVKDIVSGKCSVIQLGGRTEPRRKKKRKK